LMGGPAEMLKSNPDVAEAYLGGSHQSDYHAVKHYRRRKRWLA
jgi:branched-chain amino acid transport system ATP-binding protein